MKGFTEKRSWMIKFDANSDAIKEFQKFAKGKF